MNATDPLEEATRRMAGVMAELEAKGYHQGLIRAAVSRAVGVATWKIADITEEGLRQQAYLDILTAELSRAEEWVIRNMVPLP